MPDKKQQTLKTFKEIVGNVQGSLGGYRFKFLVKEYKGTPYLQIVFTAPCSLTGKMKEQICRKWILQDTMSTSEVVRTAFKAFNAAYNHEAAEEFHYKGVAIYSPHTDVESLVTMRNLKQYSDDVRVPVELEKLKLEDALHAKTVDDMCEMIHVGFRKSLVDNDWGEEMWDVISNLRSPHWANFCTNLKERLVKDGATVDTLLHAFLAMNLSFEIDPDSRDRLNKFNVIAREINEENALLILNWIRFCMGYKEI